MQSQHVAIALPRWIQRLVRAAFLALLLGVAGLVLALALGAADPRPVGRLVWLDQFSDGGASWQVLGAGAAPDFAPEALTLTSIAAMDTWLIVQDPAADEFSLAVAGAQTGGVPGAGYGLAYGVQDAGHFSVVLLSNEGLVTAWRQDGAARTVVRPPTPWPHVLRDDQANAVRIDVRAGAATVRINDEIYAVLPAPAGMAGPVVVATAPAQVVRFGWVKLWR